MAVLENQPEEAGCEKPVSSESNCQDQQDPANFHPALAKLRGHAVARGDADCSGEPVNLMA